MLRAILLVSLCAAAALAQTFTCQVAANCPTLPCRTLRDCNNNVCRYRATAGCCVTPNDCPDSLTDPCALPTCVNNVCGFELCPNTPTCATVCNAVLGDVNFGHCIGANGCCNTAEDCAAPAVENICAVMECVANQCVEVKEPGCCETVADCPPNACGPSECPQEGLLANHCVAPGTCCFPTIEAAALAADPNFPAGDTCNEDNFGPCDLITGCDALTGRCTTVKEEGCCETQAECDGLPCEAICVTDPLSALANHCIVSNTAPAGCCNLLDDCEPNVCQGEATACNLNRCEFAPNPDPLCCIVASDCPVTACNVALGGASCTIDNHCVPAPGCCFTLEDCAAPAQGFTMACTDGACQATPIPGFCLTAAACSGPLQSACHQWTCTAQRCVQTLIAGCQTCAVVGDCTPVPCRNTVCSANGVCTRGPLTDTAAPTGTILTNPRTSMSETGLYVSVALDTSQITDNCGQRPTCTITGMSVLEAGMTFTRPQGTGARVGVTCRAERTDRALYLFNGATAVICASAFRNARVYTFNVRCVDQSTNARTFTTTLSVQNTIAANEGDADEGAAAASGLGAGNVGVIAGVAVFVVLVAVVTVFVTRRRSQAAELPQAVAAHPAASVTTV